MNVEPGTDHKNKGGSHGEKEDFTSGMKTERLTEMANAFKNAGTLLASIEFGIFTAIAEGAKDVSQIADKTGLPEESTDRLLTVCKALDLVHEKNGRYENFSDVERYLVPERKLENFFKFKEGDNFNHRACPLPDKGNTLKYFED